MKSKKLNNKGFSHDVALILILIVTVIIGVGFMVGSHADQTSNAGTVDAWGENLGGELGQGYKSGGGSAVPIPVKNISGATDIATGYNSSLVLLKNGSLEVWGGNFYGQLGQGNRDATNDSYLPETIPALNGVTFTAIAAIESHDMALASDGTVYTWGGNVNGVIGNGTTAACIGEPNTCANWSVNTPYHVPNLKNVVQISMSATNTMVLLNNGTVLTWGDNAKGELGQNPATYKNTYTPTVVTGLNGVVKQVVAGAENEYAVMSNVTVMAWGSNDRGELGNGQVTTSSYTPTVVQGLNNVVYLSSGDSKQNHAILSNGTVMAWGNDNMGVLGIGSKDQTCGTNSTCAPLPVQVPGLTNVKQVSGGQFFTLALSNGHIYSWGDTSNSNDKQFKLLGTNSGTSSTVPVEIPNIQGVTKVSAGTGHALALF